MIIRQDEQFGPYDSRWKDNGKATIPPASEDKEEIEKEKVNKVRTNKYNNSINAFQDLHNLS